jgi:hypothetical protein
MTSNKRVFLVLTALAAAASGCGGSGTNYSTSQNFTATSYSNYGSTTSNSMTITVNGSTCGNSPYQYSNEPCASVTICSINDPTSCQTIDNILLDTGSYGLRIFQSVLTVQTAPITAGGETLGECVTYGDGSSDWGSVQYAYVKLGGETEIAAPIQVINPNYVSPPSPCTSANSTPDTGPSETGFNGILGIGLLSQDCGSYCVSTVSNGQYYACNSDDCSAGATVALGAQVTNPIALLPVDNNGSILAFGSVPNSGAASLSGTLTFGIGTTTSLPTSPTTYLTNDEGEFITNSGTTFDSNQNDWLPGFIDSGSEFYYFAANFPVSSSTNWSGFYAPTTNPSTASFVNTSYTQALSPSNAVSISVINPDQEESSYANNTMVFPGLVYSSLMSGVTDYGLPFFFGRTVYFGIQSTSSSLGTGPYFAY